MIDDGDITNPLEGFLGYQLRRASAVVMPELVRKFDELDLRLSEGSVLMLIAANPGINQSSIGKVLDIQRANMAPLIAELTKQELVQRRQINGRSFGLYLSKRGKIVATAIMMLSKAHDARIASALPKVARDDFGSTLGSLCRAWAPESRIMNDDDGDVNEGTRDASHCSTDRQGRSSKR